MKLNTRMLMAVLLIPAISGCGDQGSALNQEIQALKQEQQMIEKKIGDIQVLKQGQERISKDLEEIKKLLAARPAPPAPPAAVEKIDKVVMIGSIPPLGLDDAPLTLIEFSDYQCPFCNRHAQQTTPQIVKEYVETDKVRYVFRDFPIESIHPQAVKIAEAARCAGEQGKYWEMHDQLFTNQRGLSTDKLPEHAEAIGIDTEQFQGCLDSGKYTAAVRQDMEEGGKLGIRGTPSFILGISDGDQVKDTYIIRGAHPYTIFKEEIEKLLASLMVE
ncbi:MAG: thioredoxin domain-containing protein [Nitrosomonas halophila]